MANKKLFWKREDFVEKIENIATKIVGIGIVVLLIYAYALM